MNQKIIDWTKDMRQKLYPHKAGKILDVGSLNVNGSVKHLFSDAEEYIGIDFRDGKDVDIVMNAHDISDEWSQDTFDNVICMNMLEHDDNFWFTLDAMNRVLKRGGFLWVAMPGIDFPIHDYPGDYWRITEQAMDEIVFKDYKLIEMKTIYTKTNDAGKPINGVVCAVGQKQ